MRRQFRHALEIYNTSVTVQRVVLFRVAVQIVFMLRHCARFLIEPCEDCVCVWIWTLWTKLDDRMTCSIKAKPSLPSPQGVLSWRLKILIKLRCYAMCSLIYIFNVFGVCYRFSTQHNYSERAKHVNALLAITAVLLAERFTVSVIAWQAHVFICVFFCFFFFIFIFTLCTSSINFRHSWYVWTTVTLPYNVSHINVYAGYMTPKTASTDVSRIP